MKIRVGFGYDVHKLVQGRDLWLGGIKIEHTEGLLGHSDADVLIHAIRHGGRIRKHRQQDSSPQDDGFAPRSRI